MAGSSSERTCRQLPLSTKANHSVLVVEDIKEVRDCLAQLLRRSMWHVEFAASAVQALETLETCRFDVVLCDFDLGRGMNGLDVLQRMPETSIGTPVVILTAHGTVDRCREAMKAGAVDFLEKPILPSSLISCLNSALRSNEPVPAANSVDTQATSLMEKATDGYLRHALQVIERRFVEPRLSVAEIAREVRISPEYLCRQFRAHLDRTPLEYLQRVRISAAERLLLHNSSVTIYEVAHDCGYRGTKEFDGWFRRFNGMTPTAWRFQRQLKRQTQT